MNWLTKAFIDSAQNSWLAKYIPAEKIPAVVNLLDQKDHVLELLPDAGHGDLRSYFDAALAYRNNSPEYRQSFATVSSHRTSVFSAVPDSRDSLASDITTFSNISTNPTRPGHDSTIEHGGIRDSLPLRIDGPSHSKSAIVGLRPRSTLLGEKKYWCPSCPNHKGASRFSDFLRHLKNLCEKPQRGFKCLECGLVEKEERDIQRHRLSHNHISVVDVELPPKKAYGCPLCGNYHQSLEAYAKCICKDQDEDSTRRPQPSLRIRGLLHQDEINPTLISQCRRRGLNPDAWTMMVWDDANCARLAERLERGCNENNAACALGVENVEHFVDDLLNCAKFENNGKPVPPVKDVVHAEPHTVSQGPPPREDDLNTFPSEIEATPNLDTTWLDCFDFGPSDFGPPETSSGDIQERTAMALQDTQPEYPLWRHLTKRPASTSSSNLEAARERSKRPPTAHNSTTWNAGRPVFPSQLMDSAMDVMGNALYERAPMPQLTNTYAPSSTQAQLTSAASINTAQNLQPTNVLDYESYDSYERRR